MTLTRRKMRRIGLVVNPIAGMGGAVGLKGTDGDLAVRARVLGAIPLANRRALRALDAIGPTAQAVDWLTCDGPMGADSLEAAGCRFRTVYRSAGATTSAADTQAAASAMLEHGAELILFAGGDGTAADLLAAVGRRVPILGIPAGVKMHSAVFAISPRAAGDVVRTCLAARDPAGLAADAEIMDRPAGEEEGASPELLGYARTPTVPLLVSRGKAAGTGGSVAGACRFALERIRDQELVLIGPGTTMRLIKQALGFEGTLLGVDAFQQGKPLGVDLKESDILTLLEQSTALLVVSIVGGQGFLFGRGNQQLSADVLRRIHRDHLLIVSSMEKVVALPERRLYVDTGDDAVDELLSGYLPVIVGYRRTLQVAVGPEAVIDGSLRERAAGEAWKRVSPDGRPAQSRD